MIVGPLGPSRRDRRSCSAPSEATCQFEDGHYRGIYGARQVIAAGTRPIDASHRWRTAACHGSGLHGPVDASSVGLRCISESAAELLNRVGFPSCRLYPFAQQAVHVRCRSDSCSAKSTSSPFGPPTKDLSSLAPRVLAVPGLDARAKKRKSGFDLCFSFRNVRRQKLLARGTQMFLTILDS